MTRTAHHSHPTPAFPVYAAEWPKDDQLILGGGGGASRSGIQNKLKLCNVSLDGRTLAPTAEYTFNADEDAPMTIALNPSSNELVTGVNASMDSVKNGHNEHVRVLSYADDKFEYIRGKQTIKAEWSDDYPYQKLTAINPSGTLVAVGTTDETVTVLSLPALDHVFDVNVGKGDTIGELVDVSWSGDGQWLAVASTTEIRLYTVSKGSEKSAQMLQFKQAIPSPTFESTTLIFRAARFATHSPTHTTLYTALNAARAPKRNAPRKSYVAAIDFHATVKPEPTTPMAATSVAGAVGAFKEEVMKLATAGTDGEWTVGNWREVGGKPVTVFDVSADGRLLAYGSSDLSIGILDSRTLAPQLKILHTHSFPPTALKFNPSGTLLVSASADNTVRLIVVPANFGGVSLALTAFLVALVALILAFILQREGIRF